MASDWFSMEYRCMPVDMRTYCAALISSPALPSSKDLSVAFGSVLEPGMRCESSLRARAHFDHATYSNSVTQTDHSFELGAMLAAEECAFLFEPVTNDTNTAIVARRSQRMDCALKAVEGVGRAVHAHLKRLVVVISAGFASSHDCLPFGWRLVLEVITRAIPRKFR